MRRYLFAVPAALLGILLLAPMFLFTAYWVRSTWHTDDIFLGKKSVTYQLTGISRFKSQGGSIWLEFRPEMVSDDSARWEVYEANGQYSFAAAPDDKLTARLGFLLSDTREICVFPCWLPVMGSLGMSVLLFVSTYRSTLPASLHGNS